MYYVQQFHPRPGVSREKLIDIYKRFAAGWQKYWPSNKLVGLFVRKWAIGADPDYLVIWEIPNAAALDEWDAIWDRVKANMQDVEDEFWAAVEMVETRLMDRIDIG